VGKIVANINDKSIECIYLQVLVAEKPLGNHVYARSSKISDGRLVAHHLFFAIVEYKSNL
jgi:hypothetical protein